MGTVVDVAQLNILGTPAMARAVLPNRASWLLRSHEPEELAGLFKIICVVAGEGPVVGITLNVQGRLSRLRVFLPHAVAVGFVVGQAAIVAVHPHLSVAVITVERATRPGSPE